MSDIDATPAYRRFRRAVGQDEPVLDPTMCGGPDNPLWVDDCIILSGWIRARRRRAAEAAKAAAHG